MNCNTKFSNKDGNKELCCVMHCNYANSAALLREKSVASVWSKKSNSQNMKIYEMQLQRCVKDCRWAESYEKNDLQDDRIFFCNIA